MSDRRFIRRSEFHPFWRRNEALEVFKMDYKSLFEADGAIADAEDGDTIVLVGDTEEYTPINLDKNITIDLAGHKLSVSTEVTSITATANLTVKSTVNGDGEENTAEMGIQTMMESYPDGWTWTNGLAQERARMILPLAWLVRVKDTIENRDMLMTVVKDFLKLQDETGAIQEELGRVEMGKYPPPQSNEAYGTSEASLIAQNGDPVSDL